MPENNYQLTDLESSLVRDKEWILAKHRIIEKVYQLFGNLSEQLRPLIEGSAGWLDQEVLVPSPKIYKGERYLLFPYVMLDYPRLFNRQHCFAIRYLFWWGNEFSIHLVLSGKYKVLFANQVAERILSKTNNDWYVGMNQDPWQHQFDEYNYILPDEKTDISALIKEGAYFKMGARLALDQWALAREFFSERTDNLWKALKP
ncbi:MAG TPA: hypothetical protein VK628_02290 [Flavitalea sp.]|nr:hypothetical protein [Flavitalea sp.]